MTIEDSPSPNRSDVEPANPQQSKPDGLTTVPKRRSFLRWLLALDELGSVLALSLLIAVVAAFHPDFVKVDSLVNIGRQSVWFGIMALGMVFVLSMGEIDLSVGSLYGLTITVAAYLMQEGLNPWLAALAGIALGTVLGGMNGGISNALKIPTIIVTLGTLSMFKGLTLLISDSRAIADLPRESSFFRWVGGDYFGVPFGLWLFIGLTIVLDIVYRRTRFGYSVRAIGSNEVAARMAGIPIGRLRVYVLALMGALVGIVGMVTLAYFRASDPNFGTGFELLVIAAAIIGGTALSGGRGTVVGALFGALLIAAIRSGLIQFGLQPAWSTFATGAIIIGAVAIDNLVRRRSAKSR